ncbi:hypothetical protein DIPPA_55090 [Diplonema papillatum]|nr:hypothetical protein DIPPA_55090 [Diplonema papillatum]KAJ9455445.1 hypothetical protein DIPPA_55090 [Diplonema papillatum]
MQSVWLLLILAAIPVLVSVAEDGFALRGHSEDDTLSVRQPPDRSSHVHREAIKPLTDYVSESPEKAAHELGELAQLHPLADADQKSNSSRPHVLLLCIGQLSAVLVFLKVCGPAQVNEAESESDDAELESVSAPATAPNGTALAAHNAGAVRQRADKGSGLQTNEEHLALEDDDSKKRRRLSPQTLLACGAVVLVTLVSAPSTMSPKRADWHHVFFYAWITDLATGAGVLPFLFVSKVSKKTLGISNSIAAGMMSCASVQLFLEAVASDPLGDVSSVFDSPKTRCLIGIVLGFLFIVCTKRFLDSHEDIKFGDLTGMDAKKVLLIMMVMTLHSFTEGVGIGVAFGGDRGSRVGFCIAVCLTIHNVPEGLAVALVLIPRGVGKINTALWCIFTSFPQPVMAVPAFLFVESFLLLLPVGLGFAAGAMLWVAFFELLIEAAADTSRFEAACWSTIAFGMAYTVQQLVTD